MPKQGRPDKDTRDTMQNTITGGGEAGERSGKGGKSGGGMGGRMPAVLKAAASVRHTSATKKAVPAV